MWGTVGFLIGFLAAGAAWVVAGLPFPVPTRVPIGVVLALAVPYGVVAESVGHKIDAAGEFRGLRLWLAGVGCGAAASPSSSSAPSGPWPRGSGRSSPSGWRPRSGLWPPSWHAAAAPGRRKRSRRTTRSRRSTRQLVLSEPIAH